MVKCGFSQEELEGSKNKSKFTYEYIPAGFLSDGRTGLSVNNIKKLSTGGSYIYALTWGGGISKISSDLTISNITTATTAISTDYITAGGGSSDIIVSAYDSSIPSPNNKLDYITSTGTISLITTLGNISSIVFNGTNYFVLVDGRTDGYLPTDGSSASVIYKYNSDSSAGTPVSLTFNAAPNNTQNIESNATYCIGAQALTDMAVDRDGDLVATGYYWKEGDAPCISPIALNPPYNGIYMVIYRIKALDLTQKINKAAAAIKPIHFGNSGEIPSVMTYYNASSGSFVNEYVYAASNKGLYSVQFTSDYNNIFEVKRYDTSDGMTSTNIRKIIVTLGPDTANLALVKRIWVATDRGISVFSDQWDKIDISNSKLPSNNVQDLVFVFGSVWAATDSGLLRITPVQQ